VDQGAEARDVGRVSAKLLALLKSDHPYPAAAQTHRFSAIAGAFGRRIDFLRAAGVVAAMMIGLSCFAARGLTPPDNRPVSDLHRITEINEAIDQYVIQNSLEQPSISFDRVTDYLNLPSVRLFGFERYRRIIVLVPLFGNYNYGIFATPHDVAMELIMKSDIIVLTDPVRGRPGYPMDKKITEYWDEVDAWTRENRVLLYSTTIFGVPHTVYVRASDSLGGRRPAAMHAEHDDRAATISR
jgi:hypothetical protein